MILYRSGISHDKLIAGHFDFLLPSYRDCENPKGYELVPIVYGRVHKLWTSFI